MNLSFVLTSSSFSNEEISDYVRQVVEKKGYSTVAMVTTAHPKKDKARWVGSTVGTFESMGVSVRFVDFEKGERVEKEDVVYVCGGNTPKLLYEARKTAFGKTCNDLTLRNGLYIGSSAGSILLSPTIETALEIEPADANDIGITDFSGFGIVPFHLIVHYEETQKLSCEMFMENHSERVITLRDGEAMVGTPEKYRKISILPQS